MIPARETVKGAFKDLSIAIICTLALIIYIDGQADETANRLRREINNYGRVICQQNVQTNAVGKYNQLVTSLVDDYTKRREENIGRQDFAKALINEQTIAQLELSRIPTGTPANCDHPLLPER